MLLNDLEKVLMISPLRAMTQRHGDVRLFLELGGAVAGGLALEMGCGCGRGMGYILDHFGAVRVDGFDLDGEMVALARRRLRPRRGVAHVWQGEAEAIATADACYDAVFDFGIIHHVVAWRLALDEARRVLRPGGRFYLFELYAPFIQHPLWRRVMLHPQEDRFTHAQLRDALLARGFRLLGERRFLDQMGWMVVERLT